MLFPSAREKNALEFLDQYEGISRVFKLYSQRAQFELPLLLNDVGLSQIVFINERWICLR
jgi:hypothetical protein